MKIRSLLTLVAMLSILLFGIGTAHAVLGVPDDTIGQDIVIPFFCDDIVAGSGTLDTQWAIGETQGFSPNTASVFIFNVRSQFVLDETAEWTPFDIISDGCKVLLGRLAPAQKASLQTTVTQRGVTKTVFAGYIVYVNDFSPSNQFVSWVYFNDLPNGFNGGFNGLSIEDGIDRVGFPLVPSLLDEGFASVDTVVPASFYFPRYFFLNGNAGTWNAWLFLIGGIPTSAHNLNGQICNEEEECRSVIITLPNNLNFVDVSQVVPPVIFHDTVIEDGIKSAGETTGQGGGFGIFSTNTGATPRFLEGATEVSSYGWAYQRAVAGSGAATNWDVTHPIHRVY